MSFLKYLTCDNCKKPFKIKEENFPEDLYDLIIKYNIDQLFWLCNSCKMLKDQPGQQMSALTEEIKENRFVLLDIKESIKCLTSNLKNTQVVKHFDLKKVVDTDHESDSDVQDSQNLDDSYRFSCLRSSPTLSICNTKSPSSKGAQKILEDKLKEVKPDESEVKKCKEIVGSVLEYLIKELKNDPEFNCIYNKPLYTGSSYNDLRILSGTEYDIDIILKMPDQISLELEFIENTFAFAKMKWKLITELPESKKFILKFLEKNSISDDTEGQKNVLQPSKINSWFQSLIDRTISCQSVPSKISDVASIQFAQSGPARTVKITTTKGLSIYLDLVPVFCFNYSVFYQKSICDILHKYPLPNDDYCVIMGKASDILPTKLAVVKCLSQENLYTQQEISKKAKISQASVCRIKRSLDFKCEYGNSRVGKWGRKSKFTARTERKLIQIAKVNRRATSHELKISLEACGVNVCDSSISRNLISAGLRARRPRKKAKITSAMAKKRLAWIKLVKEQFGNDWSKVCFSDESMFTISEESSQYVRRSTSEEFSQNDIAQSVKHPTKVMVWSVMSSHGTGRLYIVEERNLPLGSQTTERR